MLDYLIAIITVLYYKIQLRRRVLHALSGFLPVRLINIDDKPYFERYHICTLFGVTFYLHRFLSATGDTHTHNHPYESCAALILVGGYTEARVISDPYDTRADVIEELEHFGAGQINRIGRHDFHRLQRTEPETWTLFMRTERHREGWVIVERIGDRVVHVKQPSTSDLWHAFNTPGRKAGRQPLNCSAL